MNGNADLSMSNGATPRDVTCGEAFMLNPVELAGGESNRIVVLPKKDCEFEKKC